jgi:type II secretory pathway component PulM
VSAAEKYVAAAYAVFLVFVLAWLVIIATKLARLERETGELVRLARGGAATGEPGDG